MTVRSSDGDKLGKVIAIGEQSFEIEKGFFILKDYVIPYSDIQDVRDGECFLRYGKEELQSREAGASDEGVISATPDESRATASGWVPPMSPETRRDHEAGRFADADPDANLRESGFAARGEEDVTRVPLARERLDVTTEDAERGEVRVHKTVETETETIEVPVRREKVEVERVRGSDVTATASGAFEEETIRVPLRSEEVRVGKEVVTEEEVQVRKRPVTERERVSGRVRREHAEIRADDESDDATKRTGWMPGDDEPTRY
ncbi:MAG TPA: YsnF/AvaK domain-containing protein [Myxococcaceae bacterium]|nr:YsnF/AvaK domain-containing protein [Myxococcaceae bacterium]